MLLFFVITALASFPKMMQQAGNRFGIGPLNFSVQRGSGINGCNMQQVDGTQMARRNTDECQRKEMEAREAMLARADKNAKEAFNNVIKKGPAPGDTEECIHKITKKGEDSCILAGIMKGVVDNVRYEIFTADNAVVLMDRGVPVAAKVLVNYKISGHSSKPKVPMVPWLTKADGITMGFNSLGQMLKVRGVFPKPPGDESCKPCKDSNTKTLETVSSKCRRRCAPHGTSALLGNIMIKGESPRNDGINEKMLTEAE